MNYKGLLQELCQKRKWELPVYTHTDTSDGFFEIICTVQDFTAKSLSKRKKEGEQASAQIVYQKIKQRKSVFVVVSDMEIQGVYSEMKSAREKASDVFEIVECVLDE